MRIRGAMIDHLRRHATICRSAMARRKQLSATRARLEQKLGRVPTDAEMSAEMGLSPADYRQIVESSKIAQPHSMDEVNSVQTMCLADAQIRDDDLLTRHSLKHESARCLGQLPNETHKGLTQIE